METSFQKLSTWTSKDIFIYGETEILYIWHTHHIPLKDPPDKVAMILSRKSKRVSHRPKSVRAGQFRLNHKATKSTQKSQETRNNSLVNNGFFNCFIIHNYIDTIHIYIYIYPYTHLETYIHPWSLIASRDRKASIPQFRKVAFSNVARSLFSSSSGSAPAERGSAVAATEMMDRSCPLSAVLVLKSRDGAPGL